MKAIILAAGRGTRLRPLTLLKPKPLLEVRGISILENMILALKKGGINEILVVTGYKSSMFSHLAKKLNFKEIRNENYASKNSAASLKLVIDEIVKGSIILNADLYITQDFFRFIKPNVSQFIAQKIKNNTISWGYITDFNCKILDIDKNATSGYGDGVAILDNENDIKILKKEIRNTDDNDYWEVAIEKCLDKINFYAYFADFYVEIDSFKDALQNNLLTPEEIAMQCSQTPKIKRLGGITNINYKIKFNNENKVIRISRNGLENIIDINAEKRILNLIESSENIKETQDNLSITSKSEFFDSNIKLSSFLNGYKNLTFSDLRNKQKVFPLIISKLKKLHSIDAKNADIPIFYLSDEIRKYENLAKVKLLTSLEHKEITQIAKELDCKKMFLCHRDLQAPNIMYNGNDIKFIDFEYAGLSPLSWELGNLTSELKFSKNDILYFLKLWNGFKDSKTAFKSENITYLEILQGQLISNYIWALWGFIYDRSELAREYIIKLDSIFKEIKRYK